MVSEAPVGSNPRERRNICVLDLTVAYNAKPDLIDQDRGYSIDGQGKPPDFVLEVASRTTGETDYTDKRLDYERFGIAEYWRFDPSGGEYHDAALAGDRLADCQGRRHVGPPGRRNTVPPRPKRSGKMSALIDEDLGTEVSPKTA